MVGGGGQRVGTPGQGLAMEGSVSHHNDSVGDGEPRAGWSREEAASDF